MDLFRVVGKDMKGMTSRPKGWLLGLVFSLWGLAYCALPTIDMRGYICDDDSQCGVLKCVDGICGGKAESRPEPIAPEPRPEPRPDASEPRADAAPGDEPRAADEATPAEPQPDEPARADEPRTIEEPLQERPPEKTPDATPQRSFAWHVSLGGEFRHYQWGQVLYVGKDAIYASGSYQVFQRPGVSNAPQNITYGMLVKLDDAGKIHWVEAIKPDTLDVRVMSLAKAPNGTLYLAGIFYGKTSFGGLSRVSKGSADAFFARFDPKTRKFVWVSTLGGPAFDEGWRVVSDSSGNAYFSGKASGSRFAFYRDGATQVALPHKWTQSRSAGFVLKIDAHGKLLWHHLFSGGGYFRPTVVIDQKTANRGHLLIGYQQELVDSNNKRLFHSLDKTNLALFGFDLSGKILRSKDFQSGAKQANLNRFGAADIKQDPTTGDLFTAGALLGKWEVSIKGQTKTLQAVGEADLLWMRIGAAQYDLKWAGLAGGAQNEELYSVGFAANGDIYLTGHINSPLRLAGKVLNYGTHATPVPNGLLLRVEASTGTLLDAWSFPGSWNRHHHMASSPQGLYMLGVMGGDVDFGTGKLFTRQHLPNTLELFLMRFNP